MKTFTFNGIPSGDYESFVFAVSKETYKRIMGKNPTKFDKSPFCKGKYIIYPNTFFTKDIDNKGEDKELIIKIEVSE